MVFLHPSRTQSCSGIMSPLWALGLIISVFMDIIMLGKEARLSAQPVENGLMPLCCVKVILALTEIMLLNDLLIKDPVNLL